MPFVFIVDDDEDIVNLLKDWFIKQKYEVETFTNGIHLLEEVNNKKPDLVFLDVKLQGLDGRDLCRQIKENVKYPVKILLASGNPMALLTYEYAYADGIINKPFRLAELEAKCLKLLNTSK